MSIRLFRICIFVIIVSLIIIAPLRAGMVSSNILTRVFNIRMGVLSGTAFTIEVDGRQYLITAKHILPDCRTSAIIEIYCRNNWIKVPVQIISVDPDSVDIVVLSLDQQLSALLPINLDLNDVFLSQSVYFIGFPYGLSMNGEKLNSGFPIALVRHGIISKFGDKKGDPLIIDAINNPGFSGGPVVTVNSSQPTVIGVVSGYRFDQEAVYYQGNKIEDVNIRSNTGLTIAYPIDIAIEAIKRSPIGYRIQSEKKN